MSTAFESFVTVHQYQLAPIPKELWQVNEDAFFFMKKEILSKLMFGLFRFFL
jgi:hypothetical protein